MRSEQSGATTRGAADLTTRARIRDVAVEVFAREGFDTSVRALAVAAGVSPALVIHHFGSKDALRHACDEQVLGSIRAVKGELTTMPERPSLLDHLSHEDELSVQFGYVLRALTEGGTMGREVLEQLIEDTARHLRDGIAVGLIRPSVDEPARARYLTLSALGGMVLSFRLAPQGDPTDLRSGLRRYIDEAMLPALELYSQGVLTDRRMLDEYLQQIPDPPGEVATD